MSATGSVRATRLGRGNAPSEELFGCLGGRQSTAKAYSTLLQAAKTAASPPGQTTNNDGLPYGTRRTSEGASRDAALMQTIDAADLDQLDAALESVPNSPAVFVLFVREGAPYLARTGLLRRRLLRLLRERDKPSRLLNLRQTVDRIEYWLTGSRLESAMRMY